MPFVFFLFFMLAAVPASAQQNWFLLAHDDGCIDPKLLVKQERLSRVPVSPDDYAEMMRKRGELVEVGLPAGFPPELRGKVVQVKVGDTKALLFVQEAICRNIDKGR